MSRPKVTRSAQPGPQVALTRYAKPPVPRPPPGCADVPAPRRRVIHAGPVSSAVYVAVKGEWIEQALYLTGIAAICAAVLIGTPYAVARFQVGQSYCATNLSLPASNCDSVRCMERDAALIRMEIDRLSRCGKPE